MLQGVGGAVGGGQEGKPVQPVTLRLPPLGRHREGQIRTVRQRNAALREIDGQRRVGGRFQRGGDALRVRRRNDSGKQAVLKRIVVEDLTEPRRDDAPYTVADERPYGMLRVAPAA